MHDLDYYGDKFKWFVGVVRELSPDNTKVRVRIFGIHRMYDTVNVSDGDLPYASVLMPVTSNERTNSGGTLGLRPDDWVMGFFADGDDCMLPVVVGVIPGSTGSSSSTPTSGGGGDGAGGGGADSGGGGVDNGTRVPVGDEDLQGAYDFLVERLSQYEGNDSDAAHAQAVAIMAHIYGESEWVLHQPNWEGEGSWGLCQWLGNRLDKLHEMYGEFPSMYEQLSYIFYELDNTEPTPKAMLLAAKTPYEALKAFSGFIRHCGVFGFTVDVEQARNGVTKEGSRCYGKKGRFIEREQALWTYDEKFKGTNTQVSPNNSSYGGAQ